MTILDLSPETLDAHMGNAQLLLDFYAPWCSACKTLDKVMASAAEKIPADLVVGKIDVEKFPLLAAKYGVTNLPRLILFKNGAQVAQTSGVLSAGKLVEFVNR